jgi:hypothetical protein
MVSQADLTFTEAPKDFTGYRIDLENRVALQADATPFLVASSDYLAPEQIDPRGKVRHDKQFNMGSCQGFSLANCCEYLLLLAMRLKEYSGEHQFSSLYAYLESQRFDNLLGRDVGSTIGGGLKVARDVGMLPEKALPYRTPYPSNARLMITDAMRTQAATFKIRSFSWLKSYQQIFDYLASGAGAVHTGTVWNNSFYASNGVLENVSLSNGGGHATAWLGYSTRKDRSGRNYIWRLNSHNDSWTELSPTVIDRLCGHPYTAIVGISDMSTPGPRNVDWIKESVFA